jgi:hypothetical protein
MTNAQETEVRARWSTAQQRADLAMVFSALRGKPSVWVHSWHATATIVWLPRFWGGQPRLFGWRHLLAMLTGVKALPNVKELMGGRAHALFHGFQANFLWENTHGTRSSLTKRDTPTSFKLDSCCSCCRSGCLTLSLAVLGGVSERILIIFFVYNPTKVDH